MRPVKRFGINNEDRREIVDRIAAFLAKIGTISFGYIYGSFFEKEGFNDIDVAVFVDERAVRKEDCFKYQLELGVELEREIGRYSIDCRALNLAPLQFRFSVITKGELVFSRDEAERVLFETRARSLYFDFIPHAEFNFQKMAKIRNLIVHLYWKVENAEVHGILKNDLSDFDEAMQSLRKYFRTQNLT